MSYLCNHSFGILLIYGLNSLSYNILLCNTCALLCLNSLSQTRVYIISQEQNIYLPRIKHFISWFVSKEGATEFHVSEAKSILTISTSIPI